MSRLLLILFMVPLALIGQNINVTNVPVAPGFDLSVDTVLGVTNNHLARILISSFANQGGVASNVIYTAAGTNANVVYSGSGTTATVSIVTAPAIGLGNATNLSGANVDLIPGANVSFSTNGPQVTIATTNVYGSSPPTNLLVMPSAFSVLASDYVPVVVSGAGSPGANGNYYLSLSNTVAGLPYAVFTNQSGGNFRLVYNDTNQVPAGGIASNYWTLENNTLSTIYYELFGTTPFGSWGPSSGVAPPPISGSHYPALITAAASLPTGGTFTLSPGLYDIGQYQWTPTNAIVIGYGATILNYSAGAAIQPRGQFESHGLSVSNACVIGGGGSALGGAVFSVSTITNTFRVFDGNFYAHFDGFVDTFQSDNININIERNVIGGSFDTIALHKLIGTTNIIGSISWNYFWSQYNGTSSQNGFINAAFNKLTIQGNVMEQGAGFSGGVGINIGDVESTNDASGNVIRMVPNAFQLVVGNNCNLTIDGHPYPDSAVTGSGTVHWQGDATNGFQTGGFISTRANGDRYWTKDGVNLTNLNASELRSGTVPTARLGSGSASSSTFLRGDQTWATVAGSGDVVAAGQNNFSGSNWFGSNTVFGFGFTIPSNSWTKTYTLNKGDNRLVSSNGVFYVIESDPTGALSTNALGGGVGGTPPFDGASIASGSAGTFLLSETNESEAIGWRALMSVTNIQNVAIGKNAGIRATNAWGNVFAGFNAGEFATYVNNSVFVGSGAGAFATNAIQSDFIGEQAGLDATNATFTQFIGAFAGQEAVNASSSVGIGDNSLQYATNAYESTAIGAHSGVAGTNSHDAVLFGYFSGRYANNVPYATFLGTSSGLQATNASYSVEVGYQSGYNMAGADHSVFIGNASGTNRANTLWIDTQASGPPDGSYQPLIYGEFDNRYLKFNGLLEVTNRTIVRGGLRTTNTVTDDHLSITNSSLLASNGIAANAPTYLFTNSSQQALEYHGTNTPGNSKGTDISNGAIGGTNVARWDALLFPMALAVGTNGQAYASNGITAGTGTFLGSGSSVFMSAVAITNTFALFPSNATASRVAMIGADNSLTNASATSASTTVVAADGSGVTAGPGFNIGSATISRTNYIIGKSSALIAQNTTAFFAPQGNSETNIMTSDTTLISRQKMGRGFKVVGIALACTAPSSGQTCAATVMTNGTATAAVATVTGTGTTASDFAHATAANVAFDELGVKIVTSATSGSLRVDWTVYYLDQ